MSVIIKIQVRRDTFANWQTKNPILAEGEPALEVDTGKLKFGDGVSNYNLLSYFQGDKHFLFVQGVASATWNINHNMGKHPSVVVVDSAGSFVYGAETHIDNNNLKIEFSAPFSGKAYLN